MTINETEIDFSKQRGYFFQMDCMKALKQMPDKCIDLCICDPPYGDGIAESSQICQVERERRRSRGTGSADDSTGTRIWRTSDKTRWGGELRQVQRTGGTWAEKYAKKIISWDTAPEKEYFQELFRVSRNQIIWGGNYFELPPTRCFLVWRKLTISDSFSMAMAEYAWTSFNENAKVFEYAPQGKPGDTRFHPCQKPVALYKWILDKYAHKGDIILDTHIGSGSSIIACEQLGFNYIGFEIDEIYYRKAVERIERETAQQTLFSLGMIE